MHRFHRFLGLWAAGAAFVASAKAARPVTADVLLMMYDVGEVHALGPLAAKLHRQGRSVAVALFGAATEYGAEQPGAFPAVKRCGLTAELATKDWPRYRNLPVEDWERWNRCVRAPLIITSGVTRAQSLLAQASQKKGSAVIAYWDSFDPDPRLGDLFMPWVDRGWVTHRRLMERWQQRFPGRSFAAVGHAGLDRWREPLAPERVRELKRLVPVDGGNQMMLYIGGYGTPYRESCRRFIASSRFLKGFDVWLAPHPKFPPDWEREEIARQKAPIRILPTAVKTREATLIADVVVTKESSVGMQAYAAGRPVLYYDLEGRYRDLLIDSGWAPQVSTHRGFLAALESLGQRRRPSLDQIIPPALATMEGELRSFLR